MDLICFDQTVAEENVSLQRNFLLQKISLQKIVELIGKFFVKETKLVVAVKKMRLKLYLFFTNKISDVLRYPGPFVESLFFSEKLIYWDNACLCH